MDLKPISTHQNALVVKGCPLRVPANPDTDPDTNTNRLGVRHRCLLLDQHGYAHPAVRVMVSLAHSSTNCHSCSHPYFVVGYRSAIATDALTDSDMFFLSYASAAMLLCYFIPVHPPGSSFSLTPTIK